MPFAGNFLVGVLARPSSYALHPPESGNGSEG